ncbi:MAG TPA: recombinase family protein [Xanthobacteraceae bacterium]|jgi:hypothetical protein
MRQHTFWFWLCIAYLIATVTYNVWKDWRSFGDFSHADQISVAIKINLGAKILAIPLLLFWRIALWDLQDPSSVRRRSIAGCAATGKAAANALGDVREEVSAAAPVGRSTGGGTHACNVDLFLKTQGLDTTTPSGRALFGMLGVFAEFERSIIQERVRAGLVRARREGKRLGRPSIGADVERRILAALKAGKSIRTMAAECGVDPSTVQRVKRPFDSAVA